MERQFRLAGPRNPDELHAWIKEHLRVDIPRVSVCPGHDAPFDFVAACFFESSVSILLMANRSGGKTFDVAVIHVLNGKFKPGTEGATVGAVESQALRAYSHVQKLQAVEGKVELADDHPELLKNTMREMLWKNGCKLEVLVGTMSGVNGPHPRVVHFDEVELADEDVFNESRNMAIGKDGLPPLDIITSTRKGSHGLMQRLIGEIEDAQRAGFDPPYVLVQWCVFEVAKRVDNCQVARPDLPEDQHCRCHLVVKGKWDDGEPRRFSDVCKGRLARSEGYLELGDLHKLFRENARPVWEAQQECSKPSTAGLVLPRYVKDKVAVRGFVLDPDNGPLLTSTDFGGSNPHCVGWYQLLRHEIEVKSYHGVPKRLPEGALVRFAELYIAEIGNVKLADMVLERETAMREGAPGMRIRWRFADMQAKAARLDWRSKGLATQWYCTRDVKEHVKVVTELVDDEMFFVCADECPMFQDEVEYWHYPKKRAGMEDDPEIPVDDFDHAMSEWRYCAANLAAMRAKGILSVKGGKVEAGAPTMPSSAGRKSGVPVPGGELVPAGPGRFERRRR